MLVYFYRNQQLERKIMKKVLIVDDEPDLRELIVFDFEAAGFNVFEAESANTALAVLDKNEIHAIVSDIRMSDGDGIYLMAEINKRFSHHKPAVIFITGFSDLTVEEAMDKGASGF